MTTLSAPRRSRQQDADAQSNKQDGKQAADPVRDAGTQTAAQHHENAPAPPPRKKRAVYYPTGDGKPMAEDVLHRKLMAYSCDALELRFASRPDVHIAGNDFLYYEEGNPKSRISPDCYVVFGVEPKPIRHFYKVWEEQGITPAVVFEFTSKKTKKEDVTLKRPLYEQILRVQEYFQFDPTGDYLHPRLQGQRLISGAYQPIELNGDRMTSEQLGLELVIEGETLRFYDPASGEFLPTYEQAETQRLAQERRAEAADRRAEAADRHAAEEARRAEAAEAELERLRKELDALRRQQ